MKPDDPKIITTVSAWAAVMIGFPKTPIAIAVIAQEISGMVGSYAELEWLSTTLIRNVDKWPGVSQVRALFATQFKPADGAWPASACELPGFRPEDFENRFFEKEMAENEKRLESYRKERLIAPPEDRVPLALPEIGRVKSVPQLPPAKPRLCRQCKLDSHPDTFIDDFCPRCGQYSKPLNLREREEVLGVAPKPENPPETVQ